MKAKLDEKEREKKAAAAAVKQAAAKAKAAREAKQAKARKDAAQLAEATMKRCAEKRKNDEAAGGENSPGKTQRLESAVKLLTKQNEELSKVVMQLMNNQQQEQGQQAQAKEAQWQGPPESQHHCHQKPAALWPARGKNMQQGRPSNEAPHKAPPLLASAESMASFARNLPQGAQVFMPGSFTNCTIQLPRAGFGHGMKGDPTGPQSSEPVAKSWAASRMPPLPRLSLEPSQRSPTNTDGAYLQYGAAPQQQQPEYFAQQPEHFTPPPCTQLQHHAPDYGTSTSHVITPHQAPQTQQMQGYYRHDVYSGQTAQRM